MLSARYPFVHIGLSFELVIAHMISMLSAYRSTRRPAAARPRVINLPKVDKPY